MLGKMSQRLWWKVQVVIWQYQGGLATGVMSMSVGVGSCGGLSLQYAYEESTDTMLLVKDRSRHVMMARFLTILYIGGNP